MANPQNPTLARLLQILQSSDTPLDQNGRLLDISTGAPSGSMFQRYLMEQAATRPPSSSIEDNRGQTTIGSLINNDALIDARQGMASGYGGEPRSTVMPLMSNLKPSKAVIDTIIAEAGSNREGMQAVAATIINRANQLGISPEEVVKQPGQYIGYSNPGSKSVQAQKMPSVRAIAEQAFGDVATGKVPDPLNGGTDFRSKSAASGLAAPHGTKTIGGNTFALGSNVTSTAPRPPMDVAEGAGPKVIDLTNGGTVGSTKIPADPYTTRRRDGPVTGLVFHHTGGDSLSGAIEAGLQPGKQQGTGANYYIDTDGSIYRYAPDDAVRVGIRNPDGKFRTDQGKPTAGLSNDNTISIEVVGGDSSKFTDAQKQAAASLGGYLSQTYKIDPSMIVGHGDIQGGPGGNKQPTEGVQLAAYVRDSIAAQPGTAAGELQRQFGGGAPDTQMAFAPASETASRLNGMFNADSGRLVPPASETATKTDAFLDSLAQRAADKTGQPVLSADNSRYVPPASVTADKTDALLKALQDRVETVTGKPPAAPLAQGRTSSIEAPPSVPSFETRPLPFSGPLTASAPSTVQVPIPMPRPAPTPAQAASMPPLTLPLNAPMPDGRGSSYGPETNQWGPSVGNLGAPSVLDLLPSGVPATSQADTRGEQAQARHLAVPSTFDPSSAGPQQSQLAELLAQLKAPVAAGSQTSPVTAPPLNMPAPNPPQDLAAILRNVVGAQQAPAPQVSFVPAQSRPISTDTGPAATADDLRPWQRDITPGPAPAGPSTLDQVMATLDGMFGTGSAQAAPGKSILNNTGDFNKVIEAFNPKAMNSSGSPDDRSSVAPTLKPVTTTTTKKVTVDNPDYNQWLLEQTKPRGDQMMTTSTGASIPRSALDAMSAVGPDAYLAPIVHTPAIAPRPAPPKTITKTITVPKVTLRATPANPVKVPIAGAPAANPLQQFGTFLTTPLWGPKATPGSAGVGGLGALLSSLLGGLGGGSPQAASAAASAPMVNISAAPAGSAASGLSVKNGGGLGEGAMVSFRPGTEQRWLTNY